VRANPYYAKGVRRQPDSRIVINHFPFFCWLPQTGFLVWSFGWFTAHRCWMS
jgi:hypothetical protein